MTDPKREKPKSDHPQEDDLSLDAQQDLEGLPTAGEGFSLEDMSVSASTDEFHFSGPVEELDFVEPANFTFPNEEPGGIAAGSSVELAAAELFEEEPFVASEDVVDESPPPDVGPIEPDLVGEGAPDADIASEEKPKRKFALPAWVRAAEWLLVGIAGIGALMAVIISVFWIDNPKLVTIILNAGCAVLLALIPYVLWRSSARWVTPAASAIYTVMLALGAVALVAGVWCQGLELSRYNWQFSKGRVAAAKPRPVVLAAPATAPQMNVTEPPSAPDVRAGKAAAAPGRKGAVPKGTAAAARDAGRKGKKTPAEK